MTKQHKKFGPGFKQSMDIGESAIRCWVRQYDAEKSGQPGINNSLTADQQRIQVSRSGYYEARHHSAKAVFMASHQLGSGNLLNPPNMPVICIKID